MAFESSPHEHKTGYAVRKGLRAAVTLSREAHKRVVNEYLQESAADGLPTTWGLNVSRYLFAFKPAEIAGTVGTAGIPALVRKIRN